MRRLANLAYLVLTLILSMCSCVSDQKLIRNGIAAHDYAEPRYIRICVKEVGPSTCRACQDAARVLRLELAAANEAQKVGKLPARARKNLKAAMKAVEETCP